MRMQSERESWRSVKTNSHAYSCYVGFWAERVDNLPQRRVQNLFYNMKWYKSRTDLNALDLIILIVKASVCKSGALWWNLPNWLLLWNLRRKNKYENSKRSNVVVYIQFMQRKKLILFIDLTTQQYWCNMYIQVYILLIILQFLK
jgi:hypothetical protein